MSFLLTCLASHKHRHTQHDPLFYANWHLFFTNLWSMSWRLKD